MPTGNLFNAKESGFDLTSGFTRLMTLRRSFSFAQKSNGEHEKAKIRVDGEPTRLFPSLCLICHSMSERFAYGAIVFLSLAKERD